MLESYEIKMNKKAFDNAIIELDNLLKNFDVLYNKLTSSNANLAAAWEGEAADKFREKADVVEKNLSQNIESIKNDLLCGLEKAEIDIINRDKLMAMINSSTIKFSNANK